MVSDTTNSFQSKIDLKKRTRKNEILVASYLNNTYRRLNPKIFTYRTINHWESQDLIKGIKVNDNSWKKFSLIDVTWIHVIGELRKFGFSIEKIKIVKENLKRGDTDGSQSIACSTFPYFEYPVGQALLGKLPVTLIVFENGDVVALEDEDYIKSFNDLHQISFISISINKLLQEALPDMELSPLLTKWFVFNEAELDLIESARNPRAELIEIKKKKNEIKYLNISEFYTNAEKEHHEMINEYPFQALKQEVIHSRVVGTRRTIKKKYGANNDVN